MVLGRPLRAAVARRKQTRPQSFSGFAGAAFGSLSQTLASASLSASGSIVASGTQASDWIARSTAPGVTGAYRYNLASTVTNFRHLNGQESNVTHLPTGGVIGDGCMRILVPSAAGAESGTWRAPIAPGIHTQDNHGFGGNEFYVQYRVKLGPRRLRTTNGGGGFKTMILSIYQFSSPNSGASAQPFAIVHHTNFDSKILEAYRWNATAEGFFESKPYGLSKQPGLDWGAGLPDQRRYSIYNGGGDLSAGTVRWEEGIWLTIYIRVRILTYGGSSSNEFDMWMAGPTDTTYTKLYDNRNFGIGPTDAQFAGGYNGIWLLPYDTARTSADYDTWHDYDQLICSTQPIAVPLPLDSTPAWFTSQVAKTWKAPVTNTLDSVYQAGNAGRPSQGLFAWASGTTNNNKGSLDFLGGGHTDNDVNSLFRVTLRNAAPAWTRVTNPSNNSGGSDATGVYSDGQPRASHTWKYMCDVPGDSLWMAGLPGVWISGQNSGRFFRFNETTTQWEAKGYHPQASSSVTLTDDKTLGAAEYNNHKGLIYATSATGRFFTINPVTNVSALLNTTNDTNYHVGAALAPERRCYVIWRPTNSLFRVYNIESDTLHSPTLNGSGPTTVPSPGMVWHEASGAFLAWGGGSGTTLYKLTPPLLQSDTFTSAWTWSTVTLDPSNAVTPMAPSTNNAIIPTLKIIRHFGGWKRDLLVLFTNDNGVYCMKLPAGGV